ncbi:MAG: radical SAM protein [Deltaproteobacteria bacterium]|nr:radical SAM protein [Deltaproteobacteria bacterium]
MPNLIITNACQLGCPFCFASEYRVDAASGAAAHMSRAEFTRLLDFAPVATVRFCGGEPTLHPEFTALLDLALADCGRRALVMTNGLWPAVVQRHVASLAEAAFSRIEVLFNLLEPERYSPAQRAQLEATLALLDPRRVTIGFTIDRTPFAYQHLLDLANGHGIRRLRCSVAAPNIGDPATWRLDPERDFAAIAAELGGLLAKAARRGVAVHSDCGYLPPCLFDERSLADLLSQRDGHRFEFRCHGPVDIGPGGGAWRCYGLFSLLRGRVDEWQSCAELDGHFAEGTARFADRWLFDRCADCDWLRDGTCGGGCYAYRVVRDLQRRGRERGIAIGEDGALLGAIAAVDPQRLRPAQRDGQPTWLLLEQGEWCELPVSALEARLLETCREPRALLDVVEQAAAAGDRETVARAVAQAARRLYALGGIALRRT